MPEMDGKEEVPQVADTHMYTYTQQCIPVFTSLHFTFINVT